LELAPSKVNLSYEGEKFKFHPILLDKDGNFLDPAHYELSWSTDDASIVSVDATGVVTLINAVGFVYLTLRDPATGLFATAIIQPASAGGSSGGGGGAPASTDDNVTGNVIFEGF